MRAIQATNPDLVFVASYPPDSVGILRAANEIGLRAKLFGGGMVGLQATAIKTQLGPLLNGIVNYDFWLPTPGFATPEAMDFLKRYQAKSAEAGVDLLGYYLPPFAFSVLQLLGQAVEATKSLDDDKIAAWLRTGTHQTIAGPITYNEAGEWTESRVLEVQFQGVTSSGVEQFRDPKTEVILWPPAYKTGNIVYPFSEARR